MRYHVINPALLVEGEWATLASLADAVAVRTRTPADGLKEGRDYVEVGPDKYRNKYLVWDGREETEFESLEDAHTYMETEGYEPTGEWSSDAITSGGHILWDGYCDYWAERDEDGAFEDYPEGFEPRIRILHRVGEASDGED